MKTIYITISDKGMYMLCGGEFIIRLWHNCVWLSIRLAHKGQDFVMLVAWWQTGRWWKNGKKKEKNVRIVVFSPLLYWKCKWYSCSSRVYS